MALEDFGGEVQAQEISALHGTGVDDLIEAILAQSEVLQLSADPKGPIEGSVIESFQEPGLGKTATVLIKRGTLMKGKFLVCGETQTRVKQILDTKAPISDRLGNTYLQHCNASFLNNSYRDAGTVFRQGSPLVNSTAFKKVTR